MRIHKIHEDTKFVYIHLSLQIWDLLNISHLNVYNYFTVQCLLYIMVFNIIYIIIHKIRVYVYDSSSIMSSSNGISSKLSGMKS